jgi:hypothetical protein
LSSITNERVLSFEVTPNIFIYFHVVGFVREKRSFAHFFPQ